MVAKKTVSICAVGDVGPRRNNPEYPYKGSLFTLSAPITKQADMALCQLERILSEKPDRQYYYDVSHPDNVRQLVEGGFNVVSLAGNHHMDAGVEAFLDTIDVLKRTNIQPVGVGNNIAEARTAVIVEKKGTRVAFLGYSSIIPKAEIPYDAEANRPGCAPMYISTFYEASDWQPGTPSPRVISMADKEDLAAMQDDVRRAKAQADVVVVSFHWGIHHLPAYLAMYQFEVGHAAIDAGADLIVGHHAHILKGIEVYKGKVIFFSLGNFGMDSPIKSHSLNAGRWDATFRPKVNTEYPTYRYQTDARKTIMVKGLVSGGKLEKVSYLPFMFNPQGQPEPLSREDKRSDEVYDYVNWCCQDQKLAVQFRREGDEVVICTD
ncbi:MAG: CapA family protein [Chloroflexi bacterium]|nr:CapA family protein [Chloroflexota bacterium]